MDPNKRTTSEEMNAIPHGQHLARDPSVKPISNKEMNANVPRKTHSSRRLRWYEDPTVTAPLAAGAIVAGVWLIGFVTGRDVGFVRGIDATANSINKLAAADIIVLEKGPNWSKY